MPSQPAAFLSYARIDDQHNDGWVSQYGRLLSAEVQAQIGEEFPIFQDRNDIAWGENWRKRIDEALDAAPLLLVIITPNFFRSTACRAEVQRFLARERALGREDLILPVYYVSTPELDDPQQRDADELGRVLSSRQFADWRELRFQPLNSPEARRALAHLATRMRDTFWRSAERPPWELAETRRGLGPQPSGAVVTMWNIPARNPWFTGRDELLTAVRERLLAGDNAVVQAFQGMGGVGKTQLAVEYAHRFADSYDLAWWVNSEQPELIVDQFAALGTALGCLKPGASTEAEVVRAVVLGELRHRGRWLLVFDSAENPADIARWLPGGGHVLITSRERTWADIAVPVEVDVLARAESIAILQGRVAGIDAADADRLADRLGDLPLAIAQAAAFMKVTGKPAAQYLHLLQTQAGKLMSHPHPGPYPQSLAAATQLIADRLAQDDPAAAKLANLCAFLAPAPIPEYLFTKAARQLPRDLAARAADPIAWPQTLGHLTRQSLARIDSRGILMHRLTQAILHHRLPAAQVTATRKRIGKILAASNPGNASNTTTWPEWASLMPHVLAIGPAASDQENVRELACGAAWYLLMRGATSESRDLASRLYQQWKYRPGLNGRPGPDDKHTMWAAYILANAFRQMGRYQEAWELDTDTHDRNMRLHGDDGSDTTLHSASALAADLRMLGKVKAAHDLDQDTLNRRARILGADDPDTLGSASNLAADLRMLGKVKAAHDLDQDTLNRRRDSPALGVDHPDTLESASNLAADLRMLGKVKAAHDLDQDTLDRRARILGADHPDTLESASNLAADLRELGELQPARDLDQDTLDRRARILGADHRNTLESASALAADLRAPGQAAGALPPK